MKLLHKKDDTIILSDSGKSKISSSLLKKKLLKDEDENLSVKI